MNFLPRDLKVFLDDYKTLHTKILNTNSGISDLVFHGVSENTFEMDFSKTQINTKHTFLISIKDIFLSSTESGIFTLSILTKDTNNQIYDYGTFYTGLIDDKKFRNLNQIGTSLELTKPVKIVLKVNFPHLVSSIFNIGITIVR
ncbi:hypothetical protein Yalta_017 [Yalta virus]|nr:hypothetical protein Yalta_017 [Yalta virus]